jgi:hypothetical protein
MNYKKYDKLLWFIVNSYLTGWLLVSWGASLCETQTFVTSVGVFEADEYKYYGYVISLVGCIYSFYYRKKNIEYLLVLTCYAIGFASAVLFGGTLSLVVLLIWSCGLVLHGWKMGRCDQGW